MENESQVRILVVDDEEFLRRLVARQLTSDGHECVQAASGDEKAQMWGFHGFEMGFFDWLGQKGSLKLHMHNNGFLLRHFDSVFRTVARIDPLVALHAADFHSPLRGI